MLVSHFWWSLEGRWVVGMWFTWGSEIQLVKRKRNSSYFLLLLAQDVKRTSEESVGELGTFRSSQFPGKNVKQHRGLSEVEGRLGFLGDGEEEQEERKIGSEWPICRERYLEWGWRVVQEARISGFNWCLHKWMMLGEVCWREMLLHILVVHECLTAFS